MDGVTGPLISKLVDTLVSFIEKESKAISTAKEELERLKGKLDTIKDAVSKAERLMLFERKEIRGWIMKLKNVVYDAEDAIEGYVVKMELNKKAEGTSSTSTASSWNKVRKAFTCLLACFSEQLYYPYKLGHNINNINQQLSRIIDDSEFRNKIELILHAQKNHAMNRSTTADKRNTTSSFRKGNEVGREDDKNTLIEQLLQGERGVVKNRNFCIVAIVGKGGLGKTYLAKMIFNDKQVKKHFRDNMWWVCVSEKPKLIDLVKKLLEATAKKDASEGAKELETLCNKLKGAIKGKQFLLVLDDVWDLDWWEKLEGRLQKCAPGSKVLITTRKGGLMERVKCDMLKHDLPEFSWEESRNLFLSHVGQTEMALKEKGMIEVGEKIVKKCGGLPLVIKCVGSLLRNKNTESEWKAVDDSEIWSWDEHDDGSVLLPGLILSYDDLPPHLKNCFVYCSLFPKDFQIETEMLTEQWIAHGFVNDKKGVDMQQTANDYLDELVSRCLLEDKLEDLKPGHLRVHDIIHDLGLFIGDEGYSHDFVKQNTRHLSLIGKDGPLSFQQNGLKARCTKLRTFLCPEGLSPWLPAKVVANMKGLRVLQLQRRDTKEFGDRIDKLLHLRYLDLSCSYIKQFPASILLRTLNISGCPFIKLLPCLLTLEVMRVEGLRRWEGWSTLHGQATAELPHLKKLRIRSCPKIKLLPRIPAVESMELDHLESWEGWSKVDGQATITLPHLKKLRIRNCQKIKLLPCIPAVEFMALYHLKNWEGWSIGGHEAATFRRLKMLWIWNCPKIKLLPCLPTVELVVLYQLEGWEGWPTWGDEAARLPRLKRLEISGCPEVKVLPHFPAVEELRLEGLPNWDRWSTVNDEGAIFPRLKRWKSSECPKVNLLPHLPTDVGLEGLPNWEGCWYLPKLPNWEGWPDDQGMMPCLKLVKIRGPRLLGMPSTLFLWI